MVALTTAIRKIIRALDRKLAKEQARIDKTRSKIGQLMALLEGQCIPWTKSTWTIGLGPVQVIVSWTKMVYSLDQY